MRKFSFNKIIGLQPITLLKMNFFHGSFLTILTENFTWQHSKLLIQTPLVAASGDK